MTGAQRSPCPGNCGARPGSGGGLCHRCGERLEWALVNIAAYAADLPNVRARLVRYGDGTEGRISAETELPVDLRVTQVEAEALAVLGGLVTAVVDDRRPWRFCGGPAHKQCGHITCAMLRIPDRPGGTLVTTARWLSWYARWLAGHHKCAEHLAVAVEVELAVERLVDRPADGVFAGRCDAEIGRHDGLSCGCACHHASGGMGVCDMLGGCGLVWQAPECGRDLYARPGAAKVTCRDCRTVYDVGERRRWMLAASEDRLLTATECARAATSLLGPLSLSRVWQWAHRGQLVARDRVTVSGQSRPRYRFGDVQDLLAAEASEAHGHGRRAV